MRSDTLILRLATDPGGATPDPCLGNAREHHVARSCSLASPAALTMRQWVEGRGRVGTLHPDTTTPTPCSHGEIAFFH